MIQWNSISSPFGTLYLAATEQGLCSAWTGITQAEYLKRLPPGIPIRRDLSSLLPVMEWLQAYFDGSAEPFDLPLDLSRLTPFHQRVLRETSRIPAGQTRTYGQIASAIGQPAACRAIGTALARNPIPIVIPCHRVLAHGGDLRGYSGAGGLQSKRFLLDLESRGVLEMSI